MIRLRDFLEVGIEIEGFSVNELYNARYLDSEVIRVVFLSSLGGPIGKSFFTLVLADVYVGGGHIEWVISFPIDCVLIFQEVEK